jgi:mono/diheme cytochrome c family protein
MRDDEQRTGMRNSPRFRSPVPVLCSSFLLLFLSACDRPPSATNLKEWVAQDHDRAEEEQRIASGQSTTARKDDGSQTQTLVDVTWRQQCVQCHGMLGKGDGPMGPMVKASDLTRDDFQARATDADIANVIRVGRGKMPKFDSLPDGALRGLVAKVRSLRGR